MGGMMVFGIVLAVAGMSFALLFDLAATLLIALGIVGAIVGGASAVYGGTLEKVWGLTLLLLGIAVAVMGLFMSFLLDLWFIQWIIRFGGGIMVISGVIMAGIGLIGLFRSDEDKSIMEKITFKGNPDKRIDEKVEEELQSMRQTNGGTAG
ncbi:MAG: hypothetical protein OXD46_01490 [Chloroflexi bacterium]|nr:hypothetical protein [Chloroflexota bacterium]